MSNVDGSCFDRFQLIYLCCAHCAEMNLCRREPASVSEVTEREVATDR